MRSPRTPPLRAPQRPNPPLLPHTPAATAPGALAAILAPQLGWLDAGPDDLDAASDAALPTLDNEARAPGEVQRGGGGFAGCASDAALQSTGGLGAATTTTGTGGTSSMFSGALSLTRGTSLTSLTSSAAPPPPPGTTVAAPCLASPVPSAVVQLQQLQLHQQQPVAVAAHVLDVPPPVPPAAGSGSGSGSGSELGVGGQVELPGATGQPGDQDGDDGGPADATIISAAAASSSLLLMDDGVGMPPPDTAVAAAASGIAAPVAMPASAPNPSTPRSAAGLVVPADDLTDAAAESTLGAGLSASYRGAGSHSRSTRSTTDIGMRLLPSCNGRPSIQGGGSARPSLAGAGGGSSAGANTALIAALTRKQLAVSSPPPPPPVIEEVGPAGAACSAPRWNGLLADPQGTTVEPLRCPL